MNDNDDARRGAAAHVSVDDAASALLDTGARDWAKLPDSVLEVREREAPEQRRR